MSLLSCWMIQCHFYLAEWYSVTSILLNDTVSLPSCWLIQCHFCLADWYSVTSILLKSLKQRLIDVISFRFSKSLYSLSVLLKRTNNYGSVSPDRLDRRVYDTKFSTHVSFLFQFSVCRITLNASFDAQNLYSICVCSHIITLSVSC